MFPTKPRKIDIICIDLNLEISCSEAAFCCSWSVTSKMPARGAPCPVAEQSSAIPQHLILCSKCRSSLWNMAVGVNVFMLYPNICLHKTATASPSLYTPHLDFWWDVALVGNKIVQNGVQLLLGCSREVATLSLISVFFSRINVYQILNPLDSEIKVIFKAQGTIISRRSRLLSHSIQMILLQ